jgi:ABC-type thiamine transport system substrate-binding protein
VALEDGVSLLNRLRMEGKNSKADVVLGLDNNLLEAASQTKLFAKSGVPPARSACRAAGITTPCAVRLRLFRLRL